MAAGDKFFAVMKNELAVSNGVATLGPDGLLNASQRPITDSMPTQGSSNPVQSGGVYSALSNKADIVSPTWYELPMTNGYTQEIASERPVYGLAGINIVMVYGLLRTPVETQLGDGIALFPEGYRPEKQVWITAIDTTTHASYALRVAPDGSIFSWGTALPSGSIMEIPIQGFYR